MLLYEKLLGNAGILTTDKVQKNRVIIFVSNSNEGQVIFEKLFPGVGYKISEDQEHRYEDPNTDISCEFIMNKFGNVFLLKDYSKESV